MFDLIAFDADDTLWHNEWLYERAQGKLKGLLANHAGGETVVRKLYETEMGNLPLYGYGIKSFTLSMIETAVELTGGTIQGPQVLEIIGLAKEMLTTEVQLLDHVEETLGELAKSFELMVVTKGDLRDQEAKLSQSGIGSFFRHVRIVSDKAPGTYRALLAEYGIEPQRFLMVGNSLRSDVLPVLEVGGQAVHIPYHLTWAHEAVEGHQVDGYYELEHLGQLPGLIASLVEG